MTAPEELIVSDVPVWTPGDYVLRGEFCPTAQVQLALESMSDRMDAEAAFIVAADDRGIVEALCFAVPRSVAPARRFQRLVRGAGEDPSLKESLRSKGDGDRELPWFQAITQALAALAEAQGSPDLASWLNPDLWTPVWIPTQAARARISVAVFLRGVRASAADDAQWIDLPREMIRVTEMVNATAHADVRRDLTIMQRVDDKLDPADYASGTIRYERATRALVELAVAISEAQAGAYYAIDRATESLRINAASYADGAADLCSFPSALGLGDSPAACRSARENVTAQWTESASSDDSMVATCTSSTSHPIPLELVTPVPGPLASPRAPAAGVLAVAKVEGLAKPFSAYDLALLRNVALRLALISATANAEALAEVFAGLSARVSGRDGNAIEPRAHPSTAAHRPDAGPSLPDDLVAARAVIEDGLGKLHHMTGSQTATFRAALPCWDGPMPYGLVLARAAAHPRSLMQEEGVLQRDEGLNWKVAREGRLRYAPNVAEESHYLARRDSTSAELCVPVSVEGRVIGVINLESTVPHAYDAYISTAQAFAAHVGLAIADARITIAAQLNDYSLEIVRRSHDVGSECNELLRSTVTTVPTETYETIRAVTRRIRKKTQELRLFSSDWPATTVADTSTFPALVAAAHQGLKVTFIETYEDAAATWQPHQPRDVELIGNALRDIFLNVKRHSRTSEDEVALLHLTQAVWGGQLQDILVIHNTARDPLNIKRAVNAYHSPLAHRTPAAPGRDAPTSEWPRMGAYLAGTHARRLGGDIGMSFSETGTARLTFTVPSPGDRRE